MAGRGEQELDLLRAGSSHSSPEHPWQLPDVLLSLGCCLAKHPTNPNPIPHFPILGVTAGMFPRAESLAVNIPSLWLVESWLLCTWSCSDPRSRARPWILGVIPHPEPLLGEAVPGIPVLPPGLCWPAARELPGPRQTEGEKWFQLLDPLKALPASRENTFQGGEVRLFVWQSTGLEYFCSPGTKHHLWALLRDAEDKKQQQS